MGEAYARNTSRQTVNDNYTTHQQRVRRAKRKRSWQLEGFKRSQKEAAEMSEEDRDANEDRIRVKEQRKEGKEFKETSRGDDKDIDRIGEMREDESEGVWTGDISVETYCRHLEFILAADDSLQKIGKYSEGTQESHNDTYSSKSSTETEDFSDPIKSDKTYMTHLCKDSEPISSDDETEILKWYDTLQCEFLLRKKTVNDLK